MQRKGGNGDPDGHCILQPGLHWWLDQSGREGVGRRGPGVPTDHTQGGGDAVAVPGVRLSSMLPRMLESVLLINCLMIEGHGRYKTLKYLYKGSWYFTFTKRGNTLKYTDTRVIENYLKFAPDLNYPFPYKILFSAHSPMRTPGAYVSREYVLRISSVS